MPPAPSSPRPTVRQRVAWWVSVVAHPFVLIPVLVAYVTARLLPPGRAALVVGLVVAGAVLPMLWIISRRVRSGAWTNYDVSVREQRVGMYPAALVIAGATSLVLLWTRAPRPVLLGTAGSLALIAAAAVVNLRLKVSLHTAFAAYATVSVLSDRPLSAALAFVTLAVAWSRLELRRHSLAEVAGGALIGAAVGMAVTLWAG
jgi:membrane-associated phospholipid phosphatase